MRHCHSVPLVKSENSTSALLMEASGKLVSFTLIIPEFRPLSHGFHQRKAATCSQCNTIIYLGPTGSSKNHKWGYCSDGVCQQEKPGLNDGPLPEWPQPLGIFTNGTHFHLLIFLSMIHQLYDKVVEGALSEMEDEAFSCLLASCIHIKGVQSHFHLYDLEIPSNQFNSLSLLIEIDDIKYLWVGCLD